MLPLLTDLHAAGVASLTLDPVAGKLQIALVGTLPDALRARVATHKAALLALCGDTSLTATPGDLATLASPPTRVWSPAPLKPGGYSNAECDVWLAENGWYRGANGRWIDPDGKEF